MPLSENWGSETFWLFTKMKGFIKLITKKFVEIGAILASLSSKMQK